ncbi:acetyl-CoA carboxylase biotin carboxylase subunit [Komagataeibacter rhaeticus]|uniref:Biotin carboxylase n=1 Tax=Komagataeibacter rhaeticus TaxID=215221 RepID=A0A181C9G6_9PROT|nr:acetyl-CoA carboxylase biotin carboxylase subunit [Komagataeibacter rhaeticus]ATU73191.1 acetyl-CoA carboxylase biotin carboxylase subunit [Komagataeibacter xylinus]QIP35063.1 acetyl-CoA carboxylase biotin carboxylase subunit [Komagataeibacter rhaeticus]QOC47616.1 acetyl-CoA carboxylase biotin carboxylase subunit [Komagataeibacter rhaeticus]WPP23035.1 acetyl-CoA carboxylase biotin carboxylase subunit [Komagataeibacter rhaeticus]SAY48217.1 Biotin carboxylase [Komagataeibacter rhaeticus]
MSKPVRFERVLIANRGEIALRIQRACRKLGLETVAVHSEADAESRHVREADVALCIGPPAAARSYLDPDGLLLAAKLTGATAIHPGYGFLSENADFADAVEAAGLTFIGPTGASIRMMGDKITAKRAMRDAGVPCVPGSDGPLPADMEEVHALAREIGFPVIVKASGGGGGRGMRVVQTPDELTQAVTLTAKEAQQAFGNPTLYLERFMQKPRHVEIQVLCDTHGTALWLGARDCSLQRRHQKVLEEAPAPGIEPDTIARIGERCAEACRRIGYRGAGTFEFLYEDGVFAFIEMNTRVQVEHPITEETTGIDIVAEQLRIAQGEALHIRQQDIRQNGHAIECRLNAEDAATFFPSPGTITRWDLPGGPGIRVDTHVVSGYTVQPYYDSLIGKIISHGATRAEAIARLRVALAEMRVEGVSTNIPLHQDLLADPQFQQGGVDIHYLERWLAERTES